MAKPKEFASRLRSLRKAAGLSSYRLAIVSGVSKQTLSKLERGEQDPSWETVKKLADALKASMDDFR